MVGERVEGWRGGGVDGSCYTSMHGNIDASNAMHLIPTSVIYMQYLYAFVFLIRIQIHVHVQCIYKYFDFY